MARLGHWAWLGLCACVVAGCEQAPHIGLDDGGARRVGDTEGTQVDRATRSGDQAVRDGGVPEKAATLEAGCRSAPCKLGDARCVQGNVSVCGTGADGCLTWMVGGACQQGCDAAGKLCLGCDNECAPGTERCFSTTSVQVCEAGGDGCFRWGVTKLCTDDVDCTRDSCEADQCEFVPDDSWCEAHGDTQCVEPRCDAMLGCAGDHLEGGACDDDDACTLGDTCRDGACVGKFDERDGCVDHCPDDPLKSDPGLCGCGTREATDDTDGDGTIDCMDECPMDTCQQAGTSECVDGELRTCIADSDGCLSLSTKMCSGGFCMDGQTCGRVVYGDLGGDAAGERTASVAFDADGNAYMAGTVTGAVPGTTFAGGGADAFLAKWDPTGNREWVQLLGSAAEDHGTGVAVDADGRVVFTRGGMTAVATLLSPGAGPDATPEWVANYDPEEGWDNPFHVSFGPGGDVYIAGGTSKAYPGFTNAGKQDCTLVRLDRSTGDRTWVQQWGGSEYDVAHAVGHDGTALYVAGTTNATSTLFLRKLAAGDGGLLWEHTWDAGELDHFAVPKLAVDASGTSTVAAESNGTPVFAKVSADNETVWALGQVTFPRGSVRPGRDGAVYIMRSNGQFLKYTDDVTQIWSITLNMEPLDAAVRQGADGEPRVVVGGLEAETARPMIAILMAE